MKSPVQILAAALFITSTFFVSCIKDDYPAKGVLVQYDPRDCACCGGIFVNLNNVDTMNVNTKVAATLPAGFTFTSDEFPLKVQFAWQNGGGCMVNNIIITKIKRR